MTKFTRKQIIDLVGRRYGKLVVLALDEVTPASKVLWRCICDCGKETTVRGDVLKSSGKHRSCGCVARALSAKRVKTHGYTGTPEYLTWRGMIMRCANPKNASYGTHGGRGIKVCDRWLNGADAIGAFECFLSDMGPKPHPSLSIERKDNDKGYTPDNCVWATAKEQAANRRNSLRVLWNGRNVALATALKETGNSGWRFGRFLMAEKDRQSAFDRMISTPRGVRP